MYKRIFTSILLSSSLLSGYAYEIEVDGLQFDINTYNEDMTAELIGVNKTLPSDFTIPGNVTYYDRTFQVTLVCSEVFSNHPELEKIHIPASIKYIGGDNFYGCDNLTEVYIEDSEEALKFEDNYFRWENSDFKVYHFGYNPLKYVYIGRPLLYTGSDGHETFTRSPFHGNLTLENFDLGPNVTSVQKELFQECRNLSNDSFFNTPNLIIEDWAFQRCGFKHICFNNGLIAGKEAFWGNDSLEYIEFPTSWSIVGDCFDGCENIKTVVFRELGTVGSNLFSGCPNIRQIYCYATDVPVTSAYPFNEEVRIEANLYVPAVLIEKYQNDYYWGKFWHISAIEDAPEPTSIDNITTPCDLHIVSSNGNIIINGLQDNDIAIIYNLQGTEIGRAKAMNGEAHFYTDEKLLIIRAGNKTVKFLNK